MVPPVAAKRDQIGAAHPSDVLRDPAVKLRAAVAEEAHAGAVLGRARQIQPGGQDAGLRSAEFGKVVAPFIGCLLYTSDAADE